MAGLMSAFRRHSGFMTNFSILEAESRPYWLQEGGPQEQVCGGPGGPGVPAGTGMPGLGTGWALAIPI